MMRALNSGAQLFWGMEDENLRERDRTICL